MQKKVKADYNLKINFSFHLLLSSVYITVKQALTETKNNTKNVKCHKNNFVKHTTIQAENYLVYIAL